MVRTDGARSQVEGRRPWPYLEESTRLVALAASADGAAPVKRGTGLVALARRHGRGCSGEEGRDARGVFRGQGLLR